MKRQAKHINLTQIEPGHYRFSYTWETAPKCGEGTFIDLNIDQVALIARYAVHIITGCSISPKVSDP